MTLEGYLNLITSEHRDKPKFIATLTAIIDPIVHLENTLYEFVNDFDLDSAVGVQLDTVGLWVGASRQLKVPIENVYFAWDADPDVGWDFGSWQGPFDPDSGLTSLPDDAFRTVIKAKIGKNNWNGTIPDAYTIWQTLFGNDIFIAIQDNQDMSINVTFSGNLLTAIQKSLLINGLLTLKPEGVRVNYYFIPSIPGKIFAWDIQENHAFAGWQVGNWANQINLS